MRKHTTQITNAHMGQSNRQWQQWAIRARKGWKERRKEAKGWGENEGGLWGEARSTAGDLHCGKTDQSQTGGRGWTPPFLLHRSNQTFPSHSQSPAAPCERRIKPRRSSCLKSAHTIVAIMKTDYHTASDISDKEELGSPVLPLMSRSSLFALIPLNSKFHYPAPSTIWLSWARLIWHVFWCMESAFVGGDTLACPFSCFQCHLWSRLFGPSLSVWSPLSGQRENYLKIRSSSGPYIFYPKLC